MIFTMHTAQQTSGVEMKVQVEMERVRAEASLETEPNPDVFERQGDFIDNYSLRCRELSSKLGRILRLMKLTGAYYGGTSLNENQQRDSSRCYLRFYCAIALLGQWTFFAHAIISLFYEGLSRMRNFYVLLLFSVWSLQCALVATISLTILPMRPKNPRRFKRFITNLLSTATDFSGITMQSVNRLLALVCFFAVFNSIRHAVLDIFGQVSLTKFRPWNGLIHYRFLHLLFGAYCSCSWAIPFLLFCISSAILAGMFESLEKKVLSDVSSSLDLGALRREHQKLCETVALADEVFSPFLLASVISDIPLICINFHQVVKSPSSNVTFIFCVSYWFVAAVTKLVILMKFGVRVNEKVKRWVRLGRFHVNLFNSIYRTYQLST